MPGKKLLIGLLIGLFIVISGIIYIFGDAFSSLLLETPVARLLLPQVNNDGALLTDFEQMLLSPQTIDQDLVSNSRARRRATDREIELLMSWASENTISVQGITKSVKLLYENGILESDLIEIREVPGVWQIPSVLSVIPPSLVRVLSYKTIYVSTVAEPSFSVLQGDKGTKLKNVKEGIILTQPITQRTILREFAHFLNLSGIEGLSVPRDSQLFGLRENYKAVFSPQISFTKEAPEGFISSLATSNIFENFAEHFTAYIVDGDTFRLRASKEPKLAEKYIFLRDQLFERLEY